MFYSHVILVFFAIFGTIKADFDNDEQAWMDFKIKYGKNYMSRMGDYHRKMNFLKSKADIENHNRLYEEGKVSYKMEINKFADLSKEEFRQTYLNYKPQEGMSRLSDFGTDFQNLSRVEAPLSYDLRELGHVTPVKDQGECASCWAFGAVAVLESSYLRKFGQILDLSEQQIIDCDPVSQGCSGGWGSWAFNYLLENGINSESKYPYTARNGICSPKADYNENIRLDSYMELPRNEYETYLKEAIYLYGATVGTLEATMLEFYAGGVFNDSRCLIMDESLNHVVAIVGYGWDEASGLDYWIVKNSWGEDWGENGYFRIARGKNMCNIGLGIDALAVKVDKR